MCGRFYLTADPGTITRRFGAPPGQGGGRKARYAAVAPEIAVAALASTEGTATAVVEAVPADLTSDDFSPLLDCDGVPR